MTDKIVVFTTCGSDEEARSIARALVERRLAACVNITGGVTSVYRWQGEVQEEQERLLIIKTRRDLFDELRTELQKMHSYEVPEIIALPVVDGAAAYLGWLDKELA